MSDLAYWVAFARVPAIGRARFERLERFFGTLRDAWAASPEALQAAGLDSRATAAISQHRPRIEPERELARLTALGIDVLTWNDRRYPPRLRETYDRPPLLYVKGALVAADEWSIAVVGTRRATTYGRQATHHLVEALAANRISVISGLARGIDTIAHQAALAAGGRTIAVLPCPLDSVYPQQNTALAARIAETGALVSETPLDARMSKESFPRRNRIIAGMTLGTLVIEAGEQSGALITARLALEENREVFAVPGGIFAPYSKGCNALIRGAGAKLVTTAEDILSELNLLQAPQQLAFREEMATTATAAAGVEEASLLAALDGEARHVDEISRLAGLPVATASATLVMLELKGLVRQVAPMRFVRAH